MEQSILNFDSPHLPDEAAVLACLGHGRESAVSSTIIEARGRVEKAIEQCDTEYGYVPVVGFKLIRRILKGGGDG